MISVEEKKRRTARMLQRLDSAKSNRSNRSNKSNKSNKSNRSAKSKGSDGDFNGHPFKAHSFMVKKKKKACNKAVRLALLEAGPFRQLLKEGVKVIVHFLRPGESRVTRVQRILIWLDDDEVEQEGRESNVQDREEYFDDLASENDEKEMDFDADEEEQLNLFGFFKLDQNGMLESSTNLSDINDISSVYMGVNTSVFKRSLDHLHGEHKSYDRSEHSNRCFSLLGAKSPFDDRACLDIEILPRDKQKPEVLSNLSNTSELKLEAAEGAEEEGAVGKEEAAAALKEQERFAGLFDGGRLPPKKLSVNYLMEEVINNIPTPELQAQNSQTSLGMCPSPTRGRSVSSPPRTVMSPVSNTGALRPATYLRTITPPASNAPRIITPAADVEL